MFKNIFRSRLTPAQDAEQDEVILTQRRVFILPTAAGLALGIALSALFIGSVNYTLNLGFALTFMVSSCALLSIFLTVRNLAYLHLRVGRAQSAFAGEDALFECHLINRRAAPRYAILAGFAAQDAKPMLHPLDIAAQATGSLTLAVSSSQRGWLRAPRVRLETRFPFGWLCAWSYWQPNAQALIYPRPEPNAPPLPLLEANTDGTPDVRASASGQEDFAGVRPYQAGDPLKRLAWRQIAKIDVDEGGALVTKHFEGGAHPGLSLDFSRLPPQLNIEAKLARLTSWVIAAEAQQRPYALQLNNIRLPAAHGAEHYAACLRALALYGH